MPVRPLGGRGSDGGLAAGIGTTGLAHVDPIPPDLEGLYSTIPDVSAQREVHRPRCEGSVMACARRCGGAVRSAEKVWAAILKRIET
jgi:hypothetical protein